MPTRKKTEAEKEEQQKNGQAKASAIRDKYPVHAKRKSTLAKDPDAVTSAVDSVYYWRGRKLVQSDMDVADRLNEFFVYCSSSGELPTVEKMCLALGSYDQKVRQWERGKDLMPGMTDATPELIKKAKQMIAATDAELVIRGNLHPTTYMFRGKNFYGMKDQVEQVITDTQKTQTKEELQKKYTDVIDVEYEQKDKKE